MTASVARVEITTPEEWVEFWESLNDAWTDIDIVPALRDGLDALEEIHYGYFINSVAPDGSGWATLDQSTIDRKGHDTILIDTERLANSLIGGGGDAIREIVDEGETKSLIFGTAVPYSIYHNAETGREHVGINEDHLHGFALSVLDVAVDSWRENAKL